jgi:hypothetical protein
MTRIVREAVDRYARRMGITQRTTEAQDPIYHFQWEHLRRVLETADMAMEDEGIPEESRSRVIRTILYGSPDEADAIRRIAEWDQQIEALRTMPNVSAGHLLDRVDKVIRTP